MTKFAGRYDENLLERRDDGIVKAVTSASVRVLETGTSTEATLYTDRTKSTTTAQPISPDANGNLEFFTNPGTYDVEISVDDSVRSTNTIVIQPDGAEALNSIDQVYNILDHGAVADGTTDDAAAIQSAIDAATAAGGGTVLFPEGTTLSGQFTWKSNVRLAGHPGATLKATGTYASWVSSASSATGLKAFGLKFDAAGVPTSHMIQLQTGTSDVDIRQCVFNDSGSNANLVGVETRDGTSDIVVENNEFDGVDIPIRANKNPSHVRIADNRIKNWGVYAIFVLGNATHASDHVSVTNNIITDNDTSRGTRQPIAFESDDANPHDRVDVMFNRIIGNGNSHNAATSPGVADMISLHRVTNFRIIGNECIDGGDSGITVSQQSRRGLIVANYCTGQDAVGINIGSATTTYTDYLAILGNNCANNGKNGNIDRGAEGRSGIRCTNVDHLTITGNALVDNGGTQQYGLVLDTCNNVQFGLNTYSGNALGDYFDSGGNTTIGQKHQARVLNNSIITFTDTDATPSVAGGNWFQAANNTATTITAFGDGVNGQEITVLFTNGMTTVQDAVNGSNIQLSGGVDWTPNQNDVLRLISDGTNWYEISRSTN